MVVTLSSSSPDFSGSQQSIETVVQAAAAAAAAAAAPGSVNPMPRPSERLASLPVYVFAELDLMKAKIRERGVKLIDLGMGNPDRPTPQPIIDVIVDAVKNPANHGYPSFNGKPEFRQAVANYMMRRYNVSLNPDTEVQPLIGSKEGIAHLITAYLEPGRVSLLPSLHYPTYLRATVISGGEAYLLSMTPENDYLPDLDAIPEDIARRASLMFINYPNNPTAAVAPVEYLEKVVAWCKKHQVLAVSDLAYSEISFTGAPQPSLLTIPGAKDIAIEFHSCSKSFNMAGWRIAYAVGNAEAIRTLYSIKTNMDYGVASAIQEGAIYALNHAETFIPEQIRVYQERRDTLCDGMRSLGWPVRDPQAAFYAWFQVPQGFTSKTWCEYLMETVGVVITPGVAFGQEGDGHFRVSLVSPKETIAEAIERMRAAGIRFS